MLRGRGKDVAAQRTPEPSFMSDEQLGGQHKFPSASMRSHFDSLSSRQYATRSRGSQQDFTANYLSQLRANRPSKPSGARPLLPGNFGGESQSERDLPPRAESVMARPARPLVAPTDQPGRSASALGHRHMYLGTPRQVDAGRPLVRQPDAPVPVRNFSRLASKPTATGCSDVVGQEGSDVPYKYPYYERGQRWMEKQEVSSLSRALHDMDLQEEARLHAAAQDEAAELVWKHLNPDIPYKNPDASYRLHLAKGSHARSQSIGPFQELYVRKGGSTDGSRTASDGSNKSGDSRKVSAGSSGSSGTASSRGREDQGTVARRGRYLTGSMKTRALAGLPFSMPKVRSLSRRGDSEKSSRKTSDGSHHSIFTNPKDQIWEEPGKPNQPAVTQPRREAMPLHDKPRNTSYGSQGGKMIDRLADKPTGPRPSIVDIHKNPPSQSRDGGYTRTLTTRPEESDSRLQPEQLSQFCVEIRGDDIRSATSMKRKDRSPKLPTPSMVSDRPGRPIVSFDSQLKPKEIGGFSSATVPPLSGTPAISSMSQHADAKPPLVTVMEPPTIQVESVPEGIAHPQEQTQNPAVPAISLDRSNIQNVRSCWSRDDGQRSMGTRSSAQEHRSIKSDSSASHWSPLASPLRAQAQCASCALRISGKVVSAAGERFHPDCFTCFQCSEHLECVAFYPEPESFRAERLARIEARLSGNRIPENQARFTEIDDGDAGLRFYCHLDFHEQFSPRCRNCKTPIEGKVIVACGGEWHEGHFFCAECGDPFDKNTPFVEKDGYAWCVGCHTRRFSGKCNACRKPVIDTVINAMGKEWHEDCFTCHECSGKFEDGQYFTRGESNDPVCVRCEEKRLKA